MTQYECSNCGATAYYDGRCGDGPVLMCECRNKGRWIDDGRGGYRDNPHRPVPSNENNDRWGRDDD
jgi:hypothetical protein